MIVDTFTFRRATTMKKSLLHKFYFTNLQSVQEEEEEVKEDEIVPKKVPKTVLFTTRLLPRLVLISASLVA